MNVLREEFHETLVPDRQLQIQERLDQFVYKQATTLSMSVCLTFLGYLYVLHNNGVLTTNAVVLSLAAIAVNIYRVILVQNDTTNYTPEQKKTMRSRYKTVTLGGSFFWVGVYVQTNAAVGNNHPANFLALLIISGLIGGTPSALGPMRRLSAANIFILGFSAAISTLYNGSSIHDYMLSGLALIYTALMIKYSDDFRKTLGFAIMERSAVESEMVSIKTLINSVPGYMTLIDKDLKYVMVNDAFAKSVPSNVVGERIGHLSDSGDFKDMVEEFAASDSEHQTKEMKMGPTHLRQHFLVSLSKIHSPFEGIAVLTMNIEDRMQMELALAKARQDMEHASRLVTIGEMVSSISHEIRNPLTIIAGKAAHYKMMATKGVLDTEVVSKEADVIIKMVDRIAKIIQTTLRFSRGDNDSQMKPTSMRQVIEDATALAGAKIKVEGVEMRVSNQFLDENVDCHPLQISQVLVNLISNAIDAMDGQPVKWVAIEIKDCSEKFQILVSDGGPGIPPELKEKIMQPFFTTKPVDKGTGLGLSISQSILENHQGKLLLLNDAPQTTFVLEMWKRSPLTNQKAG